MGVVNVNGIDIYYEIHGQGKPLVFIGGLANTSNFWAPVLDSFTKEYQCIIFDNRGIGNTTCPSDPFSIEDMALDVKGLIKSLHLKRPHIIGISMGGSIAQALAVSSPGDIDKLVLVATTAKYNSVATSNMDLALELMKLNTPDEIKLKALLPWLVASDFLDNKERLQSFIPYFFNPGSFKDPKGFVWQVSALKGFDIRKELEKIQNPTLVLHGDEDILIHPKQGRFLHDKIKGSEHFEVKSCGHLIPLERAEIFIEKVQNFLKSCAK